MKKKILTLIQEDAHVNFYQDGESVRCNIELEFMHQGYHTASTVGEAFKGAYKMYMSARKKWHKNQKEQGL